MRDSGDDKRGRPFSTMTKAQLGDDRRGRPYATRVRTPLLLKAQLTKRFGNDSVRRKIEKKKGEEKTYR